MKKRNIIIALFLLLATISISQTNQQHLKFLGKSMGCSSTSFIAHLQKKGFKKMHVLDNRIIMLGPFAGEKVQLDIDVTPKSKTVWNIDIGFFNSGGYTYERLKELLKTKYSYFNDDDFINDRSSDFTYSRECTFISIYNNDIVSGFIELLERKYTNENNIKLIISYTDVQSISIREKEIESDF